MEASGIKIDKVIPITVCKSDFFETWLQVLKSFHDLTKKDMKVAGKFLEKRAKLREGIVDPELLDRITLSAETKKEIRDEIGMTLSNFQVTLTKLKSVGFIQPGNRINKVYVPMYDPKKKSFNLLFSFTLKEDEQKAEVIQGSGEEA